jgi:hypothetical protein
MLKVLEDELIHEEIETTILDGLERLAYAVPIGGEALGELGRRPALWQRHSGTEDLNESRRHEKRREPTVLAAA